MPELIDIDPIVICPNSMNCTKRQPTVHSPNMIRVQPIVRCPEKLKCPFAYKSPRRQMYTNYKTPRRIYPRYSPSRYLEKCDLLQYGGILIIPR